MSYFPTVSTGDQLRRYARANGLMFEDDPRAGKGSHHRVCLGDRRTTVPQHRDLKIGTLHAILKQLGLRLHDLE
jgi:predicted RNA binding protein YcfA (HicA-like mRNA interferase family)